MKKKGLLILLLGLIGLMVLSAVLGLIFVACFFAVVFFVVFVKYKAVIKESKTARIVHHRVYTMDYLLGTDAKECIKKGATEMYVFRFSALADYRPEVMDMVKGVTDIDKENTLVVVGLNDLNQEMSVTIHCAKGFDEKINASINDSGILKIKI